MHDEGWHYAHATLQCCIVSAPERRCLDNGIPANQTTRTRYITRTTALLGPHAFKRKSFIL